MILGLYWMAVSWRTIDLIWQNESTVPNMVVDVLDQHGVLAWGKNI